MIQTLLRVFVFCMTLFVWSSATLAQSDEIPELSSVLSVFTARAAGANGVRLNWTLDRQSPTILGFRIYRGYEEFGNFAVLAEIPSHSAANDVDYTYPDESARFGVSYYYKLAAVGQQSESVFPVVITATPMPSGADRTREELAPAIILPGARIALYVRARGRTRLDVIPQGRTLVDDVLKPGIYEFDPPAGAEKPLRLRISRDDGFSEEILWPVP